MPAGSVFLFRLSVLDVGGGFQLLNESVELGVLGLFDQTLADDGFHFFKRKGFGWAAAEDGADVKAKLGGEDGADLALAHGEGDGLEFFHEFTTLEPAKIDHLLLIQAVLFGELHEVFSSEQFLAYAAHGVEDLLATFGPLKAFRDVRGMNGFLAHVVLKMGCVVGTQFFLGWIGIWAVNVGKHFVETDAIGDIFTHDSLILVGHANAHVELGLSTRLFDQSGQSCADGFLCYLRDSAQGLLAEQDAGDDVVFGITTEFGVSLAAGHLELALIVPFDVAKFRFDDLVVDLFTIDDQCHVRMGRQSGSFCNQEPEALASFFSHMTVLRSLDALSSLRGPVALAIGVFDGLHLGHQEVIRAAQEHARQHEGTAVVMSFEPHPLSVLRPEAVPPRLCGPAYRQVLLERLGIDCMLLCPFDENTAATPAELFLDILVRDCRPLGCISVGYGWTFGKNRGGNIHRLMEAGERQGFAVYGVPPVRVDGAVVSSTLIREAVTSGDLQTASRLLGRPYALYGEVHHGRQLARQLGFPTANLNPEAELLPPYGVYAARVVLGDQTLPAIANLGVRPTVEQDLAPPSLEVHLLDWSGDLYGQALEVFLADFIRPEKKFSGVDALKRQVSADIALARSLASV